MPFLARRNLHLGTENTVLTPDEVPYEEDVFCLKCGGRMRARGGSGAKARHFFHIKSGADCSGYNGDQRESERHQIMKSLAVSGLQTYFTDTETIKTCAAEVEVDVSTTQGGKSVRRADALIEFNSENRFFGDGVIVEVQHANETKNIPQVTADYLGAGFSVKWTSADDFTDGKLHLDRFEQAFQNQDGTAFAPYFSDSEEIWSEFKPSNWFSLPTEWQFEDPEPNCSHEFEHTPDAAQCISCGTRYQQHTESKLPIYTKGPSWTPSHQMIEVQGERHGSGSNNGHHVHTWMGDRSSVRSQRLECRGCNAKKLITNHGAVIDYESNSFGSVETREMEWCQHEWRRTGSGEECWKCGKPKPREDRWQW